MLHLPINCVQAIPGRMVLKTIGNNWWMFQEEKCSDNYVKECFIKYEKAAVNTTSKVCRKPLVRDCGVGISEEVCSTQYETECSTRERVQQVRGREKVGS